MKKLQLKKTTLRALSGPALTAAAGGFPVDPTGGTCINTIQVCVDTQNVSNCTCGPSGGSGCPTFQCHDFTFTC